MNRPLLTLRIPGEGNKDFAFVIIAEINDY